MRSNEYVICPYCKSNNCKSDVIGQSGIINIYGTEKGITCKKCGKDFSCEVEVKITYKTRK